MDKVKEQTGVLEQEHIHQTQSDETTRLGKPAKEVHIPKA